MFCFARLGRKMLKSFYTDIYANKYSEVHILLFAFGCAFQLKIIVIIETPKFCQLLNVSFFLLFSFLRHLHSCFIIYQIPSSTLPSMCVWFVKLKVIYRENVTLAADDVWVSKLHVCHFLLVIHYRPLVVGDGTAVILLE